MQLETDFTINKDGMLDFSENIASQRPAIRRYKDLEGIIYPYQKVETDKSPLYYIYREVYRKGDEQIFQDNDVRHDITVLLPRFLGEEYNKTAGHFHPSKPDNKETYSEYYEVLHGEALFLLQKNTPDDDLEDVYIVTAKKGDKVYINPNYGHVTINPSPSTHLVMSDLVANTFKSLYKPFKEKNGAAYFYIQNHMGEHEFVPNPNYENVVSPKLLPAEERSQPIDIKSSETLYEAYIRSPEAFSFLK